MPFLGLELAVLYRLQASCCRVHYWTLFRQIHFTMTKLPKISISSNCIWNGNRHYSSGSGWRRSFGKTILYSTHHSSW